MKTRKITVSAALILAAQSVSVWAGTTQGEVTISTAGSTALKNWFVANTNTFTDVQPDTQLSINGVEYPSSLGDWSDNGGNALAFQIAPKNTSTDLTDLAQQTPAVRFEYHESGSVEGILEMANDQIAPVQYVTQNIDRNPGSTGSSNYGNAVWVNYNQFGGKGGISWSSSTGGNSGTGYTLGNFYANGQTFALGGDAHPAFDYTGNNINGGQNAVQLAVSDAIPRQVFQSSSGSPSSLPWNATPQNSNYGQGNSNLSTGLLGTPQSRQMYQSTTALNMSASTINPRSQAGATFGAGAWNTAGLGNLNSQLVAVTATLFVANPGTGLTQVDRSDAQWLQLQSRLQNGATFNMTTRDVNSGTRDVAALETGIDPSWAVGKNDSGNGNASDATGAQISIGPGIKFSNKTAGGNELRPTVQVARMAVGTLSINDASGVTVNITADPLRALAYSDSTDGSAPYVVANFNTISTGQYTIFQNEQFVTVEAPDSNYGSANPDIQGDDSSGDVKALIDNTLNSVAAYASGGSPASPAAGLMAQGYIIPQLMQVRKSENGLNVAGLPSQIVPNTVANGASNLTAYNSSLSVPAGLVTALAMGDPTTVTTGGGSVYGGSKASAVAPGFVSQINITIANYLFGNFNRTGVRDFDSSVIQAQKAQAALDTSAAGDSALNGLSNNTKIHTSISALDAIQGQDGTAGATKGDLITLGDYNGDGSFDGEDLYDLAFGASLSDPNNRPTETQSGSNPPAFTTGHIALSAGENFGVAIDQAVLNKNIALDYLQWNATTSQKQEARVTFTVPTDSGTPSYATVAANLVASNVNGNDVYSWDNASADNAFNKADVNHDGQINLDDAMIVDKLAGESYSSLINQQEATINANGTIDPTGTQVGISLVAATLVDYGSNKPAVNFIQQADMNVMNTALSSKFNYAWYAGETKVGSLAISIAPAAGSIFQIPASTNFTISSGSFSAGGAVDLFTDNTGTASNGNHLNIENDASLAVTAGSKSAGNLTGVGSTTVFSGVSFSVSSLHQNHLSLDGTLALRSNAPTSIITSLTLGPSGKLDLSNGDMIITNGAAEISDIFKAIKSADDAGTGMVPVFPPPPPGPPALRLAMLTIPSGISPRSRTSRSPTPLQS